MPCTGRRSSPPRPPPCAPPWARRWPTSSCWSASGWRPPSWSRVASSSSTPGWSRRWPQSCRTRKVVPDDLRFEHRMSDMDALMWSIEKDPLLRSTITAVAVVDRSPDRDRLMDKLERGTHLIPRLRQRAMSAPFSVAPPAWVPDPNFDLRYHVRFVRATDDGSLRSLLDLATPIAMQGFDRARPLWEFTIVEGLADGRAALIQKVHHSVTDGVGGMKLALMLLDLERDPAPPTEPLPSAAGSVPAVSPWTLLR